MAFRIALRCFLYGAFLLAAAVVIIALPRAAIAEQTITVYVHDSHGPVSGAVVHMPGEGLEDVTTGSDGIAVFHPPYSGFTMYVRVRAASHKPKSAFVSSPNVDVYLQEIIATRRLTVIVKGRDPTGIHPIHGAHVTVTGAAVRWSGETDAEGVFETQHADTIGDVLKITAHRDGFEDQTKTITIGAVGISVTSTADNAAFLLEREKTGVSLIVEVLNHDNDAPISGASVGLLLSPGHVFTILTTNAKGEAHFTEHNAIPRHFIGNGLKVTVSHNRYQSRTEDIAGELLSSEAPKYLVYLRPEQTQRHVNTFLGRWRSSPFEMELYNDGYGEIYLIRLSEADPVPGVFCYGRMKGSVRGDLFTGKWTQHLPCGNSPEEGSGFFELRMSRDGKTWSGRWRYETLGDWHEWTGQCIRGHCWRNHS